LVRWPRAQDTGARDCETLEAHLVEINRILTAGAAVPFPNPMGLTPAAAV